MSNRNETLKKAYGNMPKEVGFNLDMNWLPTRGLKYYWLKLVRAFTR